MREIKCAIGQFIPPRPREGKELAFLGSPGDDAILPSALHIVVGDRQDSVTATLVAPHVRAHLKRTHVHRFKLREREISQTR